MALTQSQERGPQTAKAADTCVQCCPRIPYMPVNTRPSEVRDVTQVLQTRDAICPEPECSGPPQPTAPPPAPETRPLPRRVGRPGSSPFFLRKQPKSPNVWVKIPASSLCWKHLSIESRASQTVSIGGEGDGHTDTAGRVGNAGRSRSERDSVTRAERLKNAQACSKKYVSI